MVKNKAISGSRLKWRIEPGVHLIEAAADAPGQVVDAGADERMIAVEQSFGQREANAIRREQGSNGAIDARGRFLAKGTVAVGNADRAGRWCRNEPHAGIGSLRRPGVVEVRLAFVRR